MSLQTLKSLLKAGTLRTLKCREGLIDLTSNDYLGLAKDATFQTSVLQIWEQWNGKIAQKVGSTGSRLLTGNHFFFEATEEKIAAFHGYPTATLFNCGYMANLALLSALPTSKDTILIDLEAHASFHDAIHLTKAKTLYFRHNDLNHLETRLKHNQRCFVVIESLYSMSGTFAPLKEIASLCDQYQARLIVDEAHALSVLGPQGKGIVAQENLNAHVFAWMGAFGKGVGVQGAVILGSSLLKKTLLNCARPLIYSTSLAVPLLAAIFASYDRFPTMQKERRALQTLCRHFHFPSFIAPLVLPGASNVKFASYYFAYHGIDLRPIVSPSVPRGQERLRLTLHAFNTQEEIKRCLTLFAKWRGE